MLLTIFVTIIACIEAGIIPENIYKYAYDRDSLIMKENEYANKPSLTEDEQIVETYFSHLKAEEFSKTRTAVPPSRPIKEQLDYVLGSPLYQALKTLPKGGNMHNHESYMLNKGTLLDIVFNSTDFPYLYVMDQNSTTEPWKLDFFVNPPADQPWVNVKNSSLYTKETILTKQTLMSILSDQAKKYPSDAIQRWQEVNTLWTRSSDQLINNRKIKGKYIKALLEAALNEGVQYIETRRGLYQMYEMDADPEYAATYGKKYIGGSTEELEYVINIIEEFKNRNPSFIGVKFISSMGRTSTKKSVQKQLETIIDIKKKYPEYVIGCDISAQENAGKSELYFIEEFLSLYDEINQRNKINLYLHISETNFPDDQRFSSNSMDPTSALQNTYEAVALRANRIGHGLGYIKHPYLMNILKQRGVAIEVCAISNQLLGFVPDLRNHPALNYYRHGVPIVLGSDEEGLYGYNHFTVDWYMVYFGWGLDLADLKHLSTNAINYSGMNQQEKETAHLKLSHKWNQYILDKKTEACNTTFNDNPIFAKLLPTKGSLTRSTNISLFGSHFEAGICQSVKCKFGETVVDAKIISVQLIRCSSPPRDGATDVFIVPVFVSLDGEQFIDTKYNFTYEYKQSNIQNHGHIIQGSILFLFAMLFHI